MATVESACELVRSKNAGPFWITIDLFFKGAAEFERYCASPHLNAEAISHLYGVDVGQIRHYPVASLSLLKISFPRRTPQGGVEERDLHSGQQFVRLLGIELDG